MDDQRPSGRPDPSEAAPYYFGYIDRVPGVDVVSALEAQLEASASLLQGITEERSLYRYAPAKWSIRELLGHVTDTERVMLARAHWFARGFASPLPSFDQNTSVAAAHADAVAWAAHRAEFRAVRQATLALLQNLPTEAWLREGVASDNRFSVRALAYLIAGHFEHHRLVLVERYA